MAILLVFDLPLPFAVLFGLSYSGRDVIYPLVVIHVFGVRHLAPVYGGLMLSLALGGVGGPIFTAAVRDQTGSYTPAFALSAAMMLRYSLNLPEQADRIEAAVAQALRDGARSADLGGAMTTVEMGDAVLAALR